MARYLEEHGMPAERKALHGSSDVGDLRAFPSGGEIVIEVKAGKQTANPTRMQLEEWKRQTMAESRNSGKIAALVVVRFRRQIESAEVWIPNGQWMPDAPFGWTMMYLDEFARRFGKKRRRR